MSTEVAPTNLPPDRRLAPYNLITFPKALRDAIPDLPTYVGRSLKLASIDGHASRSDLFGPRAHLKLIVQETGKLNGEFTVRIDLQADAARALGETLIKLADQLQQ